jgi:hypothetical protein
MSMEKHFVTFFSPGTFVAETTEKPIDAWDVEKAVEMARGISERYGAKPYGFRFSTRSRKADELDSKVTKTSGIYYLGGQVQTKEQVFARNDPKESILRANMECNEIDKIIINDNSWRYTGEFSDGDTLLDVKL